MLQNWQCLNDFSFPAWKSVQLEQEEISPHFSKPGIQACSEGLDVGGEKTLNDAVYFFKTERYQTLRMYV